MSAVATPTVSKKARARSPVPTSTERPFRGTITQERPESDTALPSSEAKAESAFMEGKAMAALMVREGTERRAMCRSNLNASYRDPGEPQDNFTLPFLRLLQREPHLLPGFTAGLSSLLVEADTSGDIVEATAQASYSACTEHRDADTYETFDAYSAPSLDEQISTFALEDLSTAPLPSNDISSAPVPRVPGADAAPAVQSTDDVLTEVGGVHDSAKHVLGDWIDSGSRDSAAFGLMTLVDRIEEIIDAADRDADHSDHLTGLFSTLSVAYLEAAYVGRAVIHWAHEDLSLWAVVHLLDHCKHLVDAHVDALTEAAARKRMSDG